MAIQLNTNTSQYFVSTLNFIKEKKLLWSIENITRETGNKRQNCNLQQNIVLLKIMVG